MHLNLKAILILSFLVLSVGKQAYAQDTYAHAYSFKNRMNKVNEDDKEKSFLSRHQNKYANRF